ncbi:P-loop containing nucleoside triphosphate hydrolase protein [Fomitiporia mediterranea MF3/22]|uniref:P-loop containing nucleoside triphosphate hydrolase protein n=1 Tax=Fomitiporia mediterranea (strain MF3/22) TaxID=694068 RepID=UPI0004408F9A|nr:P-loop containing nucleoside triphosphate hydrolase protein [Fomitiporia mediterranea MF3/22]EJD04033.1 P-loop containing nucleoside triphosphate hydrolase protein [Fomitiporia mediterranea MF3/22]
MSDSFDIDDDEFADFAFLQELDAIEAASQQPVSKPARPAPVANATSNATSNVPVPSAGPRFKPALRNHPSSDEFDGSFDVDAEELDRLDAFIADSYAGKAQPVAGPSRTRQTTLDGRTLPNSPIEKSQPKRSFSRTKSAGNGEQKAKTWDRTGFSETGFRSTKKKGKGKGKGKGKEKEKEKSVPGGENIDDDFNGEEMEFEQFPSPYVDVGPPPPMKLKPDLLNAKDWVFPLNRPRRDYQFNIAKKCLFQNTLVALPTGLGKTFIAGVVMLNYYRWFPDGKIVFVAPTKPLVAQQVTACHDVCGIPGSDAALLTGEVQKHKRSYAWAQKRVIYMTPQTLVNDLVSGLADPLDIVLLVIDEAHRGTGDYAYAQVVRYMMAKNPHFRILALTATPGNNPEAVQAIVDSLHISHIEIRNESSFDLQRYIFKKEIQVRVIKMGESVLTIQRLLCKITDPLLDRARKAGIVYARNAMSLHPYSCVAGSQKLATSKSAKARWMFSYLRVLGSLARAMGNLMESSVSVCYRSLKDLKENLKSGEKNDDKEVNLLRNPDFIKLMEECERQQALGFAPHPKMKALVEIIMDHFNTPPSNPETPAPGESTEAASSSTKVMIFVGLREVIDEVVDVLDQYKPMLRATRFVGQGIDKKGKKGLAQAKQLETIQKFKDGEYNILVSTSVGEEGLDIGEIDRIICYDSSKSSIQMLQRVGRTGRKRTGYVDVLLAEEREERNWDKSKENYADVQDTIISGNQLELYTDAERLLPDNIEPSCLQITMPIEKYMPDTKDSPARGKGATVKKRKRNDDINRNIPLGASMGFVSASKLRPKAKKGKKTKDMDDSDLEDDSDDEEIANGLHARASKSKKKSKKSNDTKRKPSQRNLVDMLKAPIPDRLDDDSDDLDIQKGLKSESESTSSSEPSVPKRPKKRKAIVSSSSSDDEPKRSSAESGPSSSGATIASAKTGHERRTSGWLLESGSEAETSRHLVSEKLKPASGGVHFRSAKSLGVIETVSSPEPLAEQIPGPSSPVLATNKKVDDGSQASPEPTFAFRRPTKRKLAAPPSSPTVEQNEAPRRLVRRRSPSPPPSAPLAPGTPMGPPPVPQPQDIRNNNQPKKKKPKLKMSDNPALFDVEAEHSGSEVSSGGENDDASSILDMLESSSDRRFLEELPETQASPSYNQTAAYRMSLMTQAPTIDNDGNGTGGSTGPQFKTRPKRVGAFAGGRTQVLPKPADWNSSSPVRGSEPDEYQMGSFVVNDDDDAILYEQSSEV